MNTQQQAIRTPWHLWVVGGLFLIFNAFAAFGYLALLLKFEPYLSSYPEEVLAYYFQAPLWMYVLWGVSIMGGFFSALLLVLRRKLAIYIGIIAWLASVGVGIYTALNPAPIGGGITATIMTLIIALIVIAYMVWLSRRGVLR